MVDLQRKTANLTPNQKITSSSYSYTITTHPLIDALKSITPNEDYTLSWEFSSNGSGGVSNQIRLYISVSGTLIKILQSGVSFTLTSEEIAQIGALFCYFGIGNTDGYMDKFMLVEGSTPLPYEPYGWQHSLRKLTTATDTITTLPADLYADGTNATVGISGNMEQNGTPTPDNPIQPSECGDLETTGEHAGQYKIPISSANTTTPVYLGEVETTRKIKKIVFVGSEDEDWSAQSAGGGARRFRYTISNSVQADTAHPTSICTHLPLGAEGGTWNTDDIYTISSNYLWVRLDGSFTTVALLKSWLAQQYANGTPVTVWYVLATPETAVVNEPLMKIGDYADTVSSITVPMITGRDAFDVETTLKPSEASLSYTGWHDATVQEWDGSQWNE